MSQRHGHGVVICISSVGAQMEVAPIPLYTASKAALSHFVRSMGVLESTHNIRINAVAPGNVRTTLWTDAGRDEYIDESKGDEWMTPDEVATFMIKMVTKGEYVGGSVWELGKEHVRRVNLLMDPGVDHTKKGLTMANLTLPFEQMQTLITENFGKLEVGATSRN